jgi:hypothetical protein
MSKVTTCSPVLSDGYVVNGTSTLDGRGYNYTAAFYGVNNDLPSSMIGFGEITGATYIHSDFKALELQYDADLWETPYIVA